MPARKPKAARPRAGRGTVRFELVARVDDGRVLDFAKRLFRRLTPGSTVDLTRSVDRKNAQEGGHLYEIEHVFDVGTKREGLAVEYRGAWSEGVVGDYERRGLYVVSLIGLPDKQSVRLSYHTAYDEPGTLAVEAVIRDAELRAGLEGMLVRELLGTTPGTVATLALLRNLWPFARLVTLDQQVVLTKELLRRPAGDVSAELPAHLEQVLASTGESETLCLLLALAHIYLERWEDALDVLGKHAHVIAERSVLRAHVLTRMGRLADARAALDSGVMTALGYEEKLELLYGERRFPEYRATLESYFHSDAWIGGSHFNKPIDAWFSFDYWLLRAAAGVALSDSRDAYRSARRAALVHPGAFHAGTWSSRRTRHLGPHAFDAVADDPDFRALGGENFGTLTYSERFAMVVMGDIEPFDRDVSLASPLQGSFSLDRGQGDRRALEDARWLLDRGVFVVTDRGVFRDGKPLQRAESIHHLWVRHAIVLAKLGRRKSALRLFEQVLAEAPGLPSAVVGRALLV